VQEAPHLGQGASLHLTSRARLDFVLTLRVHSRTTFNRERYNLDSGDQAKPRFGQVGLSGGTQRYTPRAGFPVCRVGQT
jgi:hypothetical protein